MRSHPSLSPQPGILLDIEGQSGTNMCLGGEPDTGELHSSFIGMNVCCSAYIMKWCVVNGIVCATAADLLLILSKWKRMQNE